MSKHIVHSLLADLNDWVDGYDVACVSDFDYEEYNAKRLGRLADYEFAVVWDIHHGTILELGENGTIKRALHGFTQLRSMEIQRIYGEDM
jgi:hypothetical protein